MLDGTLRVEISGTFTLSEATVAHRLLESRKVTGKLILMP
jgi:NADPH:quinone reductase-like Zn-dependent oxidoreductase